VGEGLPHRPGKRTHARHAPADRRRLTDRPGDQRASTPTGAGAHEPNPDDELREELIDSQVLHRGRYLTFRVDRIRRADGTIATRDVCGHPGAVAILALDDDGNVLLVRQWRHPANALLLEI